LLEFRNAERGGSHFLSWEKDKYTSGS
jgi:hypothetical protein